MEQTGSPPCHLGIINLGTRSENLGFPPATSMHGLGSFVLLESGEAMTGSISPLPRLVQLPNSWV